MRPDEHKKKQRADYKKKHGITNKKTASKEKSETTKAANTAETQNGDDLADISQVRSDVRNLSYSLQSSFPNCTGKLKAKDISVKRSHVILVSLGRS